MWTCPDDRVPLEPRDGDLACPQCGLSFPCADDVPLFGSGNGFGSSNPVFEELWELMHTHSADEAAQLYCEAHDCHRRASAADWKFLLPIPEGGRVLEIGAGFADDTLVLSGRSAATFSLVPDARNAVIVRKRLREAHVENVHVAVVKQLAAIPLPSGSVDAIALEDVAARGFGLTNETLPAAAAEMARVLAPGGAVLVGVRNAYRTLPGARALFPAEKRESLNRLVKRAAAGATGRLSRARIVSCMQQQGFSAAEVFAPIPGEQSAEALVPLNHPEVLRFCLNRFLRQNSFVTRAGVRAAEALISAGLLPKLLPYYYLVFRR